ncbi:MAG: gluconate 2-dehydrogenase subunit 3 family protein [Bacteroidota bacterium]
MDRRRALKNIGLSLGGLTISSTVAGLLQSCQSNAAVIWTPTFFSQAEAEIVAKTLEVILPVTEDIPGALDLNLAQFIDGYMKVIPPEEERLAFKAGIEQYLTTTLETTGKKEAVDLTLEDIDGRLAYYLKATDDQKKTWSVELGAAQQEDGAVPSPDAANFGILKSLRGKGIDAFKMNEYIGEEVMAYSPIPGQQKGCVDLEATTGGMAWSL